MRLQDVPGFRGRSSQARPQWNMVTTDIYTLDAAPLAARTVTENTSNVRT